MSRFDVVYKCRLCGLLYTKDSSDCYDEAFDALALKTEHYAHLHADIRKAPSLSIGTTSLHTCADGSIGISDLQGMKEIMH